MPAVHARKHQVEDDETRPALLDHLQPHLAVVGDDGLKALPREVFSHQRGDIALILDDQYRRERSVAHMFILRPG